MPEFISPSLNRPRGVPVNPSAQRSRSGDSTHSYGAVADRLRRAVEAVERRTPVNPASRVGRWTEAIERLAQADKRAVLLQVADTIRGGAGFDHPYRDSFVALTESRSFVEIVENLLDHLSDGELRELISGHPDPASDKPSTSARDREFEWFAAAIFLRGGVPVALAEPDVLLNVPGGIRSLAVKRISSRQKAELRIKEASEQIRRSGHPGYLVIDITRYINPDLHFIVHWRSQGSVVGPRMLGFAGKPAVVNRRNKLVLGVFLRAAFPLISPGFQYGTYDSWVAAAVKGGKREEHIELLHAVHAGIRDV